VKGYDMTKRAQLFSVSILALAAVLLFSPIAKAHSDHPVKEDVVAPVVSTPAVVTPESMSGGVGEESRAEIEAVQKNYTLKATFAGEGGIFLDDVHVVITDAAKNTVLTVDPEGPILLVKLKPGKYVVTADAQGIVQKANVSIKNNRLTNITLRFPIGE